MTEHQLQEVLDIIHWSRSFAKTDGQYIRVSKAREWVETEIKEQRREKLESELKDSESEKIQ